MYTNQQIVKYQKRMIFFFGGFASLASITGVIMILLGVVPTVDQSSWLGLTVASAVLWIILMGLAYFNKVFLVGILFCISSTSVIGVAHRVLPADYNIYVFYLLNLVLATTFISPLASGLYGLGLMILFVGISVWNIYSPLQVSHLMTDALWYNTILFGAVLFCCAILLFTFNSALSRLLQSFRGQAEELSRLNTTMQRQRDLEGQIILQVSDLTSALGLVFREQNDTTQRQSNIISDVATTTQELDAAARRIADNALSVATVAEKAQRSVEVGQQAAYQGVTSIAAMRERVHDISENMRTLTSQIDRINEVIGIIGEIADETNLLALNATIEAAGAREYGRRFAAVADEVQRLARRATNAVEQIQEMVGEINEASSKTVAATEQGLREAQLGDKLVSSLTIANDDVIQLVAQTSSLASNIAGSTQQQREASAQIVDLMQQIIEISENMNQATRDVSHIVVELESSSGRLKQVELSQSPEPANPRRRPGRLHRLANEARALPKASVESTPATK